MDACVEFQDWEGYYLRAIKCALAQTHLYSRAHDETLGFTFVLAGNLEVRSLSTLEVDVRGAKIDGDFIVEAGVGGWCARISP